MQKNSYCMVCLILMKASNWSICRSRQRSWCWQPAAPEYWRRFIASCRRVISRPNTPSFIFHQRTWRVISILWFSVTFVRYPSVTIPLPIMNIMPSVSFQPSLKHKKYLCRMQTTYLTR